MLFRQAFSWGNVIASVFALAVIVGVSACTIVQSKSEIKLEESYEITKGACGSIVMNERMGDDFQEAFNKLKKEKQEYYSKWCPEAPCHNIKLETKEIEVVDDKGNVPKISFKAVRVLDKETGHLLHGLNDVIADNGYHYHIAWCPD